MYRLLPPHGGCAGVFLHCIQIGLASAVVLAGLGTPASSTSLSISSTDLWDVSQGTAVIADSGAQNYGGLPYISDTRNMFGDSLPSGTIEPNNTLFRDNAPAGTVHYVEWQTSGTVTLRSFALFAAHDGGSRDANYRGFSSFELFAWNAGTSQYDSIFNYAPANPYGSSVAPANGFLADNCTASNMLCLGVNLLAVTTDKFRAEFVQRGSPSNASGPRVWELDGYDTYFQSAAIPATPLPGSLPFFISGLLVIGLMSRRRWMQMAKVFA